MNMRRVKKRKENIMRRVKIIEWMSETAKLRTEVCTIKVLDENLRKKKKKKLLVVGGPV